MLIQKLYTNISISITIITQGGKNMNVQQLMNEETKCVIFHTMEYYLTAKNEPSVDSWYNIDEP